MARTTCHLGQGSGHARPMPAAGLAALPAIGARLRNPAEVLLSR